jgi:hypothetical protein
MRARALLLLFSSSEAFLREGGKPPISEGVECLLRPPSIFGKEKKPNAKKGGKGFTPPPPTHNFASPHLPNKYHDVFQGGIFTAVT